MVELRYFLFFSLVSNCVGFLGLATSRNEWFHSLLAKDNNSIELDRGTFLTVAFGLLGLPLGASATDELFRPNPLTNPVLEQV